MRNARTPAASQAKPGHTTRSDILDILALAGLGACASTVWVIERMTAGLEADQ